MTTLDKEVKKEARMTWKGYLVALFVSISLGYIWHTGDEFLAVGIIVYLLMVIVRRQVHYLGY